MHLSAINSVAQKCLPTSRKRLQFLLKRPGVLHNKLRSPSAMDATSQVGDISSQVLAVSGILAGGTFASMYFLQKQENENLKKEIEAKEGEIRRVKQEQESLQIEASAAKQEASDLQMYKKRMQETERDMLKLERALEMKDAQLESFMTVGQRQIKLLEERIKELKEVNIEL